MAMDQGEELEANVKGTKRKSPPMQDTISSDEEDVEDSVDDTSLVNDLLASKREAEERANDLIAELNAERHELRLLTKSQNIPPQDLDSHLLAAELDEEQYAEARGDYLETGPSGSATHPEPILTTNKKKPPTDVSNQV